MDGENKVLYKELSYHIVGAAYNAFKITGYGLPEKYCQEVYAGELKKLNLHFVREFYATLKYQGVAVQKFFLDFGVEEKVVVELKVRPKMGYVDISQVMTYLKATNKKLAILVYFTKEGVKYRRILNSYKQLPQ